jgi:hypothetical protein
MKQHYSQPSSLYPPSSYPHHNNSNPLRQHHA